MDSRLKQIELWLKQEVAPIANVLDSDPSKLKAILQQMGDRSLLALKAPVAWGGMGLSETEYQRLQITFARTSGALTFLQAQHQSAVGKLLHSENSALRSQFLPDLAQGRSLMGVGFSHLRRRGTPMVQVTEKEGKYLITGEVPWITGCGFFERFIVGATLADGRELYGILPLKDTVQESGGAIACSQPMALLAVGATNTVSAKIEHWQLEKELVVSINPPGTIYRSSQKNILNHGFFALGNVYAALDVLDRIAQAKQLDFLTDSWQTLHQEAKEKEQQAIAFVSESSATYTQKLQLRGEIINLAQRCSMAAVIASSGAANYRHSDAARVYREALLFSVSGQTTDVMQASIQNLLSYPCFLSEKEK
ncbi:MAG: acyl-CoA dehydrogenase family protein [Cyanobacteria bacterium P01_C01_bin.72]